VDPNFSEKKKHVEMPFSSSVSPSLRFLFLLVLLLLARVATAENLYEILGVAPDADDKAIKKAYRNLSLKYHPGEFSFVEHSFMTINSLTHTYFSLHTYRQESWRRSCKDQATGDF